MSLAFRVRARHRFARVRIIPRLHDGSDSHPKAVASSLSRPKARFTKQGGSPRTRARPTREDEGAWWGPPSYELKSQRNLHRYPKKDESHASKRALVQCEGADASVSTSESLFSPNDGVGSECRFCLLWPCSPRGRWGLPTPSRPLPAPLNLRLPCEAEEARGVSEPDG